MAKDKALESGASQGTPVADVGTTARSISPIPLVVTAPDSFRTEYLRVRKRKAATIPDAEVESQAPPLANGLPPGSPLAWDSQFASAEFVHRTLWASLETMHCHIRGVEEAVRKMTTSALEGFAYLEECCNELRGELGRAKATAEEEKAALAEEKNQLRAQLAEAKARSEEEGKRLAEERRKFIEDTEALKDDILAKYEAGFARAVEQSSFLYPDGDFSAMSVYKYVQNGELVDPRAKQ